MSLKSHINLHYNVLTDLRDDMSHSTYNLIDLLLIKMNNRSISDLNRR